MSLATKQSSEIDAHAPIVLRRETEIAATPEAVWAVLAEIDAWAAWSDDVASASLHGELAAGTTFRWKAGGSVIRSRLTRVAPPHAIAWSGRALGLRAIHAYRLEPHGSGTLVRTEESVGGGVARLFRGPLERKMGAALANGLRCLRDEVERRAATAGA
jgi:uncharacterized protein YndB with AHSA1/START domain